MISIVVRNINLLASPYLILNKQLRRSAVVRALKSGGRGLLVSAFFLIEENKF